MSARVAVSIHLAGDPDVGKATPFRHDGRTSVALEFASSARDVDVSLYVQTVDQANALLVLANEARDALVRAAGTDGADPLPLDTGDAQ